MMAKLPEILIPAQRVPVLGEYDVLVCGGGSAGVCAAVAAARAGARVLLVERYGYFGGMATAADVTIWHTRYATDGRTPVIAGLTAEILERLARRNAVQNSQADGRGHYILETEYAKLVYDDLVREAGVTPLLHTWVSDVVVEDGAIAAVLVENKSGRQAIRARMVVDATGDADVAARAGVPFEKGDAEGLLQPPSLCFRVGGVDVERAQREGFATGLAQRALNQKMDYNGQEYPNFLWQTQSGLRPNELMLSGVRVTEVDATDAWDFTRAELDGRRQLDWVLRRLQAEVPGFENASLADIGAQIGVRETRRIHGAYCLREEDLLEGTRFPDPVAQGTYPVDIHHPTRRGIQFKYLNGHWREIGADGATRDGFWTADGKERQTLCYQVPYRCLIPQECGNLLVAGRPIAATHEAHGAIRVMVNCNQVGQAAGAAAALCAAGEIAPRQLEYARLRRELDAQQCVFLPDTTSD